LRANIHCEECGTVHGVDEKVVICPCGKGLAEVRFEEIPRLTWDTFSGRSWGVWRYKELIPVPDGAEIVSLGEGGTPLVKLVRGPTRYAYLKFEGANPTGSFKDRGMTVATTVAKYLGVRAVVCASTGNTSSSMSAYAARAGLRPIIILPEGKVARGKLSQAILHGATIVHVKGNFDDALKAAVEVSREGLAYLMNSINPWRIEGQKTVAFEILEEMRSVDWIVLPVGNAGNISALWKGLKELHAAGLIDQLPRLAGIQASGAAPLAKAFKRGAEEPDFVDKPETVATAIRIGRPVSWKRAMRAVRESGGVFEEVSDEEILEGQRELARVEGIGVEPASAAAYAGLKKLVDMGIIGKDERVAVIATGHALKDPEVASSHPTPSLTVDVADVVAVVRELVSDQASLQQKL